MTPAFLAYATSARRPCCSLVAVWVLAQLHPAPADPTVDAAWARLDPAAWRLLNVATGDLWSCPEEAARLLGGHAVAEPTRTGAWHVVQRWDWNHKPKPEGHAYIVQPLGDGTWRVVQSDTRRGYRDAVMASWTRAGCEHLIVEIPPRG